MSVDYDITGFYFEMLSIGFNFTFVTHLFATVDDHTWLSEILALPINSLWPILTLASGDSPHLNRFVFTICSCWTSFLILFAFTLLYLLIYTVIPLSSVAKRMSFLLSQGLFLMFSGSFPFLLSPLANLLCISVPILNLNLLCESFLLKAPYKIKCN